MQPSLLIIPVTICTIAHYLLVGRERGMFNVDGVFVLSNWTMAAGTLWLLDDPYNFVDQYALVIAMASTIYVLTSIVIFRFERARSSGPAGEGDLTVSPVNVPGQIELALLFAVSLLVTIAYYYSVGYNVFALGLQSLVNGQTHNYTDLRLQSYSTSRYLFPGYVNQFKNVILPTLAIVWIHHVQEKRAKGISPVSLALALVCIFALLGTGQRGAFILFGLAVVLFIQRLSPAEFGPRAIKLAAAGIPLLMFSTFLLGRSSSQLAGSDSLPRQFWVLTQELMKRFMYDNQWSGIAAFKYIGFQPTQWGGEWVQAVMGILPSNSGSSLASDVFAYLYGTNRGTAPISLWGSVYYNFSWLGVMLFPVLLAILWSRLTQIQNGSVKPNALEIAGAAGVAAVAGMWAVGGPEYLLNAGAVTYGVLWWMGRRLNRLG